MRPRRACSSFSRLRSVATSAARFIQRSSWARHAAVHALLEAGHSRRSIQRQLGMTWRTVKQLAEAAAPEELFTGQWQNRPLVLDDYKP